MRKFEIDLKLSDQHRQEFRDLCSDDRKTVDWLWNWLKERNCIVARCTAALYRTRVSSGRFGRMRAEFRIGGEVDARRKLAIWANELGKSDLMALASFAGFLAFASGNGGASKRDKTADESKPSGGK